jgi:BirA family transcriptional regulator, biotin operon repressor / biotin---[acetyl-CoA-carboxylase] ligase
LELLTPERISAGLQTERFGREIHYYEQIGSTNDIAHSLAEKGAPEGTIVVAEEQTRGRGRLGRAWLAPAGSALLVSIIFRPDLPVRQAFRLTMLSSLAGAVAVELAAGFSPSIKWPNDLLVADKKLAGILSEASVAGSELQFLVVGIGLNVNFDPAQYPEIAQTATSASAVAGHDVSRLEILQHLLGEIEARYATLYAMDEEDPLWTEWRSRLGTLGREVTVTEGEQRERGTAIDVTRDGSLLLRRHDGSVAEIAVGDVTLRE